MDPLTPAQLTSFYERISLPSAHRHLPSPTLTTLHASPTRALSFLTLVIRHTLSSIPFTNISLHYSPTRTISLQPTQLYDKLISSSPLSCGRGGYCMENNALLLRALDTMGFSACPVGARISASVAGDDLSLPRAKIGWAGWSHMVLIVTLADGKRYLVDVGFGVGGATTPIELVPGREVSNVPGEGGRVRLVRERLADARGVGEANMFWVFERLLKVGDREEWRPNYAFTEMEFLQRDFEVMSFWTSKAEESWFTREVVCVRKILGDVGEGEVGVVGDMVLWGREVKRRVRGKVEWTKELRSDEERVEALKQHFGIELTEDERRGIEGLVSMIKG